MIFQILTKERKIRFVSIDNFDPPFVSGNSWTNFSDKWGCREKRATDNYFSCIIYSNRDTRDYDGIGLLHFQRSDIFAGHGLMRQNAWKIIVAQRTCTATMFCMICKVLEGPNN